VEFWLPPEERSPLTYKIRDLYHKSPLIVITLGSIAIYLLGRYTSSVSILVLVGLILVLFAGIILGHLFWTKHYVEGEQESPAYLGED